MPFIFAMILFLDNEEAHTHLSVWQCETIQFLGSFKRALDQVAKSLVLSSGLVDYNVVVVSAQEN